MCLCCNKSKPSIYFLLIGHILLNIIILIVLLISTYDLAILNWYQKAYLIITIIVWIILIIYSTLKLFLIIFGKFTQDLYPKKVWLFIHVPAFSIVGFALIYDLYKVPATSGIPGLLIYYFLMVIICALFIISSLNDYFRIQSQIDLSQNKVHIVPLEEENDYNISKKIN